MVVVLPERPFPLQLAVLLLWVARAQLSRQRELELAELLQTHPFPSAQLRQLFLVPLLLLLLVVELQSRLALQEPVAGQQLQQQRQQ